MSNPEVAVSTGSRAQAPLGVAVHKDYVDSPGGALPACEKDTTFDGADWCLEGKAYSQEHRKDPNRQHRGAATQMISIVHDAITYCLLPLGQFRLSTAQMQWWPR